MKGPNPIVVNGILPPSKLGIVIFVDRRDAQLLVGASVVTGIAQTEIRLSWHGFKVYSTLTLMEHKR